jgi:hypothetical protein
MRIFSRIVAPVALIALAIGMNAPAAAQQKPMQKYGEEDKAKTPSDIAAEKEAERAYQRSLGNIPAQQSTDPWGTVRSDNAAPKAAKAAPAKPKAKTADTPADAKTGTAAAK